LKDFGFFQRIFLKTIFLHGEIFEFPYFLFCLKIFFNVIANCILYSHTYYYQHMSFSTTLQHKKTHLIINSSIDIRFDWLSLIIFSLYNKSQLLMLFCYFYNRPTQFFLIFLFNKNRSNLLAHSFVYLLTIKFDCLIPTEWLEVFRLQISKLSSL